MFSFFKKHKKSDEIKNHLNDFRESFTEEQKKALLVSLYVIANSDKEFHTKEVEFFQQTADILDYPITGNMKDEFSEINRDEVFEQLKNISENQKKWYLTTVIGMIHADGKVMEEELVDAEQYLSKMGITKEKITQILKTIQLFS